MTPTRRKFLGSATAATATLAMPAILHAAPKITLKIAHYLPASHGFQVDFIQPWAENLKTQSDGAIDYKIYDATTSFGRADRLADQVRGGVVDIVLGLCGIPRGRFPHSSIVELPFVVDQAQSGSNALWSLYQEGRLGKEYDDFKVLMLMTHPGGLIHTVNRPVRQLSDLKGLRLRTPGPAVSAMLEYLGASPLALPPAEIYQALSKSALDGLLTTWDLVSTVHANEVLKYHTDCRIYGAAFYYVMNERSFGKLSPDLQKLIEDNSGDALVSKAGPWWDKWEATGKADAVKRNQEIITIDDAMRAQWRDSLRPMTEQYLANLAKQGVENPQAIYQRALDLIREQQA